MIRKVFFPAVLFLFIIFSVLFFVNRAPASMSSAVFTVNTGDSTESTARMLSRANLVRSSLFFRGAASLRPRFSAKPGRYRIIKGMSTAEILLLLHSGRVITRKVTIPEGYNLFETAKRLEEKGITGGREFLMKSRDRKFLFSIGIKSPTAEGFLFPDTYNFREGASAGTVIKTMYGRFRTVFGKIFRNRGSGLGLKAADAVILASLIEEEARIPGERRYISSVFHNRLRRGMKLDCDPTVRYAVKRFRGAIRKSDLETDSPFNTYLRRGLPPTPISCPGKESLKAALDPAESDFLFFVARNDGSHYFSRTLREHNRAVQKYMKGADNGFIDTQKLGKASDSLTGR